MLISSNITFALQINLSELARKYGITGTRKNVVVREFLEDIDGGDLSKFNNNNLQSKRLRRKYFSFQVIISLEAKIYKIIVSILKGSQNLEQFC